MRVTMQGTIAGSSEASNSTWFRRRFTVWLVTVATVLAVVVGWRQREYHYLTAETGMGYALGIVGSVLMISLLIYPLRKRLRSMAGWGSVRGWFQVHMLFGVIGPVLILYHSNFETASINGTVALYSMLTVAISGVIGRYFHHKTHYGLLDSRAALHRLQNETKAHLRALGPVMEHVPPLREQLERFCARTMPARQNLPAAALHVLVTGFVMRRTRRRMRRQLRRSLSELAARRGWPRGKLRALRRLASDELGTYLVTVRRVTEFAFYERLFGLWHMLHLPLFIMMVITGIFHVIAVHMY